VPKADDGASSPSEATWADTIIGECARLNISVTPAEAILMARHLWKVYEANAHTNLTRVSRETAPLLHVGDSLSGLGAMIDSPPGPWADMGSGAGFPGIPLAVMSGRHVDLIESVGKKAAILRSICESLCLDVSVLACRAEDAGETGRERWSAVAARAVAQLPALVELASPLLVSGGVLVCWKGALTVDEQERGDRAAGIVGMGPSSARRFLLPDGAERAIVVYKKDGRASVSLPRRAGLAQRSPLA
jgi:16S rRNA (guanine527-N7)-methyltransferase